MISKPHVDPDVIVVRTVADFIDIESTEYVNTRRRIVALLDSSVPDNALHMPHLVLSLNGSEIESHAPDDFFVAAHGLSVSIHDLKSAISRAEASLITL
ncbi:hypothetical protein HOL63_00935 [Candidatus Peregrinibacteria bacterium]|nr:hypothetical protein [Candidatus Peregrinibacteria bacterium]MBT5468303.1 hypothetical protein [Candidatus Peregrinibacteria bacterium]